MSEDSIQVQMYSPNNNNENMDNGEQESDDHMMLKCLEI